MQNTLSDPLSRQEETFKDTARMGSFWGGWNGEQSKSRRGHQPAIGGGCRWSASVERNQNFEFLPSFPIPTQERMTFVRAVCFQEIPLGYRPPIMQ
eukprot:5503810-Amphidinium_carterae.1